MTSSVAFVGAGPTTLYTLAAFLSEGGADACVTIFEEQDSAGLGTPYRPGWNDPALLSNIASIEIPPVCETLIAWLIRKPEADLRGMGVDPETIDDRTFVPRIVLGQYFHDQFEVLVAEARARGVGIDIRTGCRVIDVENANDGVRLTVKPRKGVPFQQTFDRAVLATGHQWPSQQEVRPGYFLSPWPAEALANIPAVEVGIRGSSLTAIDAAVILANAHGAFVRQDDVLTYSPGPESDRFRLTMLSRKGLLPEADFFFPLPHEPLSVCTPEAIERLIAGPQADLLERAYDLFRREMILADPAWAQEKALSTATLEQFGEAYFAERATSDPFEWAKANLREARDNHSAQLTVPWRYVILKMHEVIAAIVPHLDGPQFQRFNRHFKPVFVDCYASVPHESIERLLALHRAGRLDVLALSDDYRIDTHRPEGGVMLDVGGERRHFPVFIEATGQKPLSAVQFPFLSLLEQGIVRDEASADAPNLSRGIAIDDRFHPVAEAGSNERLFCLSLPFIMGRHPFVQGITSSHEIGRIVGLELARVIAGDLSPHPASIEVEAA